MPLPLLTQRLRLRPPTDADLIPLRRVYQSQDAMRYITGRPLTDDEIAERIHARADIQRRYAFTFWTIERREDDRILGVCGLVPIERTGPEIEIGYHLEPDAWGRGYATEAARESLRFAFEEAELHRVIAVRHPDNAASGRVMQKLRMRPLGLRRYYDRDQQTCEITTEDWRATTTTRQHP